MVAGLFAFVNLGDGIFRQRIVGKFLHCLPRQFATVHEDASLVAFDENTVVGVMAND